MGRELLGGLSLGAWWSQWLLGLWLKAPLGPEQDSGGRALGCFGYRNWDWFRGTPQFPGIWVSISLIGHCPSQGLCPALGQRSLLLCFCCCHILQEPGSGGRHLSVRVSDTPQPRVVLMLVPWALPLIAGTHRHTGTDHAPSRPRTQPPKSSPCSILHIWGGSLPTQHSRSMYREFYLMSNLQPCYSC